MGRKGAGTLSGSNRGECAGSECKGPLQVPRPPRPSLRFRPGLSCPSIYHVRPAISCHVNHFGNP